MLTDVWSPHFPHDTEFTSKLKNNSFYPIALLNGKSALLKKVKKKKFQNLVLVVEKRLETCDVEHLLCTNALIKTTAVSSGWPCPTNVNVCTWQDF